MQKLQPLQQKIQAKYANDEQTKNQLMAQLFQSANVNPLAGCFPALVQIPVFISLYRSIQNLVAENKLSEPFLWIPDLEGPTFAKPPSESMDWLKSIATGNPTLGWHDTICFLSLPLILYISQTISQKVLQPPKDPNKVMTEQEQFSQGLVNNLPFIVAFFSINVPAGLAVYWIVNNVLSTLINVVVKNSLKNEEFPVEVAQMMALVDSNASAAKISAVSPKAQELFRPTVVEDRPKVEGFGTPKKDVVDAEIVTDSEHMANESKDKIGDSMTMTENEASNADEGMDSESKKKRKRAKADKRRK